jgi:hypothetical protein
MKSASLSNCRSLGHVPVRHSPDGVDIVLECQQCCMAWLIKAITGDEVRIDGSSCEKRLTTQKLYRAKAVQP